MAHSGSTPTRSRITSHRLKRLVAALAVLAAVGWTALPSLITPAEAQAQSETPNINVSSVILAEPAVETPFPIHIDPPESIPDQTFLRIRGLPRTATLSEGHAIAAGAWAIPLSGLPRLKIAAPEDATGKTDVTISLVAIDGRILSEVKAMLLIAPASAIGPATAQAGDQIGADVASAPAAQMPFQPPVPPPPAISAENRDRALAYVQRGDDSLANGNVTVARLFYTRAAELEWGPAALALAATFDPVELERWNVIGGVTPDAEEARNWYERARELGTAEAVERLQRLSAR